MTLSSRNVQENCSRTRVWTFNGTSADFDEVRRKADEFARTAYADVFARFERLRSGLDVNLPIVSAIIEREHNGEKEMLVQTRWKPDRDPLYSGTLEIPAGGMHVYENVYDAVKREVLEETGLQVTSFYPDIRTKIYAPKEDDCFAFVPFCYQQQLKGGLPRVGPTEGKLRCNPVGCWREVSIAVFSFRTGSCARK